MAQLLHLESEDPEQDINLYINSPGGSVTAGLAIYDTMQFVKPDISTTALGMAARWAPSSPPEPRQEERPAEYAHTPAPAERRRACRTGLRRGATPKSSS